MRLPRAVINTLLMDGTDWLNCRKARGSPGSQLPWPPAKKRPKKNKKNTRLAPEPGLGERFPSDSCRKELCRRKHSAEGHSTADAGTTREQRGERLGAVEAGKTSLPAIVISGSLVRPCRPVRPRTSLPRTGGLFLLFQLFRSFEYWSGSIRSWPARPLVLRGFRALTRPISVVEVSRKIILCQGRMGTLDRKKLLPKLGPATLRLHAGSWTRSPSS